MTFYLKPPRGVITFNKLEACVQQRLDFYNKIDKEKIVVENFDCLVEDTGLDRTGHYMLRLYAYSKSSFNYNFIINEQKLLKMRLDSYNPPDTKKFFRRLLKHCRDVLEDNLNDGIREFCLFLEWLVLDMLKIDFLRHIYCKLHVENDRCSKIYFSG